eukprot:m.14660 g.14660  ORF g.14660 m.14660 type:complete len:126 (-) comp10240_c0_seq1:55-432(-)
MMSEISTLLQGLPSTKQGNFSKLGTKFKRQPPVQVYTQVEDPNDPAPQVIKNDEQSVLMRMLYKGRQVVLRDPSNDEKMDTAATATSSQPTNKRSGTSQEDLDSRGGKFGRVENDEDSDVSSMQL